MTIVETVQGIANAADATLRNFINKQLPALIAALGGIATEDALESEVEQAFAAARKASKVSRLAKQLAAVVVGFFACGFRGKVTHDEQTGETRLDLSEITNLLTKTNTVKLLDRVMAMIPVYKLINRLYAVGVRGKGILAQTRAYFRETVFPTEWKKSLCERAIFQQMLGFEVSDACFEHFVTGYKLTNAAGEEIQVKSRLAKYEQSKRLDEQKGTDHASKLAFTAEAVEAWEVEYKATLEAKAQAAAA